MVDLNIDISQVKKLGERGNQFSKYLSKTIHEIWALIPILPIFDV